MKKLHIGSGALKFDGYVNIDIEPSHKPDICADVLTMNYEENSIDVIYSCHFAEHLSYPEGMVKFLELSYKWLKPGGVFRIAVPDLELATKEYSNGGNLKFLYGGDFKGFYYKDLPSERLNFFVKAWEHQMCYDFKLLASLLYDAGFKNIHPKEPNDSLIPNFDHDRFISESLYVECVK